MQFTLKPDAMHFVEEQVKAGHFQSADALINEAVARMMIEGELQLDEGTVAAIQEADEQFKRGDYLQFDEFAAQMRKQVSGK